MTGTTAEDGELGPYSLWTEGLTRQDALRALVNFGIALAVEPELALVHGNGPDIWGEVAANHERLRATHERRYPSQDAGYSRRIPVWPWLDPLSIGGGSLRRAGAGDWLEGPSLVDPPFGLSLTVSRSTDVLWLSETLRSYDGCERCFAAGTDHGRTTSWRFPLLVGFLPSEDGIAAYHELQLGLPNSSWQSKLIKPVVMSAARVTCDILVVHGETTSAPTRIVSLEQVGAGAVVVLDPELGRARVTMSVLDKIGSVSSGWAVGVTQAELGDRPSFVVRLVEELSHALPFDQALTRAARGLPSCVAAHPEIVEFENAKQRAGHLAATLRKLSDSNLRHDLLPTAQDHLQWASRLSEMAIHGHFLSEAGDASEQAALEEEACALLDQVDTDRRLQARLSLVTAPDQPLETFRPASEHRIEVKVDTSVGDGWIGADTAFPDVLDSADPPRELTVVLTEPQLLDRPQVTSIVLPAVGPSSTAEFVLTTRKGTESVDARILVLSGNRLLQTVRLPSAVSSDRGHEQAETGFGNVAEPELLITPASTALADRRGFAAAFLVNHNLDAASRMTSVSAGGAAMVRLDSNTIKGLTAKISERLTRIVDWPEDYASLDAPASVKLLTVLAFHGAKLRRALLMDTPRLEKLLTRPGGAIQVTAATPDAWFPFEFAYDYEAPQHPATLCAKAVDVLMSDDPRRACPGPHGRDVVCPTGFWGMRRVIERHTYHDAALHDGFAVRSRQLRTQDTIDPGRLVYAVSNQVDKVVPNATQAVVRAVAPYGDSLRVDTWEAWKKAVGSKSRAAALLLLLSHTVYDEAMEAYGLEIGAGSRELNFTGCLPRRPSLVMLLGCDTALADDVSYEAMAAEWRLVGAKAVIATLTDVLGRHAAPIAASLMTELQRQCQEYPHGLGDVMLAVRRRLVAEGMLPVLALTAFGDADWMIQV